MPPSDASNNAQAAFLDPHQRRRTAQTRRGPNLAGPSITDDPMSMISTPGANRLRDSITPSITKPRTGELITTRPATALSIDAIIFDVDGVIADTAERHAEAWRRLADEEGFAFDETIADSLRGLSRAASLKRLLGDHEATPDEFKDMMERKNRYYVASLESITPSDVLPGITRLMRQFAKMNVKVAAASASKNARLVLDRIGLVEQFDAIVDGNEVGRPKPAPDLFARAAARLRIKPNRCVVVEDAAAGIMAAHAAGMRSIGLGDGDRLHSATLLLPSFDEIEAVALIEMLDAASN